MALAAWQRFEDAKGPTRLFARGNRTEAYTLERSSKQWARVRTAYVELRLEDRRQPRRNLETWLSRLEARYQPTREKAAMTVTRRKHPTSMQIDVDRRLLRRFRSAVSKWESSARAPESSR